MLTQTVTITQNSNPNIIIGRRSTYETQQVIFDVSWLIQTYGEGTAELLIKRPKDASAYPVVATLDGNTLTWTVSDTDTQDKGHGECEIYWYVNGGLAKSCICGITILRDIGDTTETAPDPYETWVDELARLGAETLVNAQAAQQSADSAAQSASEADNSAAAALESEENALNSENAAKASEQAAAASKQGAEQSATEAAQSANAAESSAANAQESADNSSASADRAEQAAASIEGDTERAEAAARTAQGAASDASGFAGTASTKATEAAGSAATAEQAATTATQKASDASASATAADDSASSASASATAAGNAQTAAETAQGKAEDAQEAAETAAQSIEDSAAQIDTNTADILNLKSALSDPQYGLAQKAGLLRDSTGGAVASFVPDASVENLLGLTVDIEPVQDLHGQDAPYPPGGGKNKAFILDASFTNNGVPVVCSASAETVTLKGTAVSSGGRENELTGVITLPAGSYVMSATAISGTKQATYIVNNAETNAYISGRTFTLSEETPVYIGANVVSGTAYDEVVRLQIESGSTATAWTPYSNLCPISGRESVTVNANGTTHTIQLGQTVYGGTLDVTNGVLTVDRYEHTFTGSEPSLALDSAANVVRFTGSPALSNLPAIAKGIFSHGVYNGSGTDRMEDNTFGTRASGYCYLKRLACTTLQDFKDWFTEQYSIGTPVQISYILATPIVIQLDQVAISTISGQTNNVWADAGDVSVEYAADLKTYIDNKIAAAVAAMS